MVSKKSAYLLTVLFAVVVVAVIFSLDTDAKPENADGAGCGDEDSGCHRFVDNKDEYAVGIYIKYLNNEGETAVDVIFYNGGTGQPNHHKLEYEWNDGKWDKDKPVHIAAELTESKDKPDKIYHTVLLEDDDYLKEYGPRVALNAPDGGQWRVWAGYYNKSDDQKYYTWLDVDVDYTNHQPVAKTLWDGYDKGLAIKSNGEVDTGINGTTKDALFKFDEYGQVKVFFLPDCSDPDPRDEDNLSYHWDFNNEIDADSDGDPTDDNDTSQQGTPQQVEFTFFQANHPEDWESKEDPEEIFETDKTYTINFACTDNHLYNAWDWATLNIRFQAPKRYPDLEVTTATFSTIDTNDDGNYSAGEPMYINVTIRNIGENSTLDEDGNPIPFKLSFEDDKGNKIIKDIEYKDNLEPIDMGGNAVKLTYKDYPGLYWQDTSSMKDGIYDITIIIDSGLGLAAIDEGSTGGEDNNILEKKEAFEFTPAKADNPPELVIEKITLNGTDYSSGVYEILEDNSITINITVKNKGLGPAEVFKIIVYLWKTDTTNPKDKDNPVHEEALEPGDSIQITHIYTVFLTDGITDNQTLKIVIEYETEEVASEEIKLLVSSVKTDYEKPNGTDDDGVSSLLLPIIGLGACVAVVIIVVVLRSRSYYDEDEEDEDEEEDEEDEDEEEDEEDEDEGYKSRAKKYKSRAKK